MTCRAYKRRLCRFLATGCLNLDLFSTPRRCVLCSFHETAVSVNKTANPKIGVMGNFFDSTNGGSFSGPTAKSSVWPPVIAKANLCAVRLPISNLRTDPSSGKHGIRYKTKREKWAKQPELEHEIFTSSKQTPSGERQSSWVNVLPIFQNLAGGAHPQIRFQW